MTPEARAREQIGRKLEQAGWVIQDMGQLDLSAVVGVAVREYPTHAGPANSVPPQEEQDALVRSLDDVMESGGASKRRYRGQPEQSAEQRVSIRRTAFAGHLVPQDLNNSRASALLARFRAKRARRDATKHPRGRGAREST